MKDKTPFLTQTEVLVLTFMKKNSVRPIKGCNFISRELLKPIATIDKTSKTLLEKELVYSEEYNKRTLQWFLTPKGNEVSLNLINIQRIMK